MPVGYLYCIGNPRTDWMYRTVEEKGLGGRSIAYPRGKVMGGSSSINGMIYMRGQAADYDGWAQLGAAGWSWDEVLPVFVRSEKYHRTAKGHGSDGEMLVERQRLHWPILDAVREAADEIGIPPTDDFNLGDNEGSGYFEVTQRSGLRWSAARAFLPRQVRKRPNLAVLDRTQVTRLLLDGGRVTGVEYERDGQVAKARAARQVVLAAGAIGTPQIMMLSGLGPAAHLGEHGIEVVRDLPGVGANLQDHLQIRTSFRISGARTLNDLQAGLWGKAQDRRAIRAVALGADGDGAEPARPLHTLASALCDAQHRVPCAAAVARRLRRAAAPSSGDHRLGLQSAAEQHRCGAARLGGLSRCAGDRAELPFRPRGPRRGGRVDQACAPADGDAAHGGVPAG